MLLFVSDLHLTDDPISSTVSDSALTTFAHDLGRLSERSPIKLVLLGDIVDLLRSSKWLECWEEHRSAPWKAMSPGFANFVSNYPEEYALDVAHGVIDRYQGFAAVLASLVAEKKVSVTYVIGNHDYMLQLSTKLRQAVCSFLSLSPTTNDWSKPFPTHYENEPASVYATHGHSYDPVNWHRSDEGYWAMGDAIVLRVVNRFIHDACKALGVAPTSLIGRTLHELDNIEPTTSVPAYIRWIVDDFLVAPDERHTVLSVWRKVVSEFLELETFKTGYDSPAIQKARTGFAVSRHMTFAELAAKYASYFPDRNLKDHANELSTTLNQRFRFIVFGHTHHPALVPLSWKSNKGQAFYVNTGCWRRVVSRPATNSAGPFTAVDVRASFQIDDRDEGGYDYRLSQECLAT
jgi:UDP-2,3-diacylglucosamine pyrophosphatase LpxH